MPGAKSIIILCPLLCTPLGVRHSCLQAAAVAHVAGRFPKECASACGAPLMLGGASLPVTSPDSLSEAASHVCCCCCLQAVVTGAQPHYALLLLLHLLLCEEAGSGWPAATKAEAGLWQQAGRWRHPPLPPPAICGVATVLCYLVTVVSGGCGSSCGNVWGGIEAGQWGGRGQP